MDLRLVIYCIYLSYYLEHTLSDVCCLKVCACVIEQKWFRNVLDYYHSNASNVFMKEQVIEVENWENCKMCNTLLN